MKMTAIRSARLLGCLLLAFAMLAVPGRSFAQGIAVSITIAPPALPVYVQPICPGDGYLWTPGYWAWDDGDYYWVPGTWIMAPEPGFLWTPGYWGWNNGVYAWNVGYWGEHIGFYGGVNYGFGYGGVGFGGGYWQGGHFFYNTSVMHVNTTIIHNTYNKTVINTSVSHVSFNGGTGGISARPTAEEERYASERHIAPTATQTRQQETAAGDRSLRASVNHGRPAIAATARPGDFKTGVVAARGGSTSRATRTTSAEKKPATRTSHENTARTESKPSRPATSEHATAPRTEAKPAATHHQSTAKTEGKPAKAAKAEHATTPHTEAKPAATHHETPAHTESAPKAEHTSAPKPEHESAPKAEHTSAPKPQHESAPKAEHTSAPKPQRESAPKAEHTSAPKPQHESAPKAEHTSAPKPQHESAPKAESKPAPKEEAKPHR
jgi:hypothetical protein